ncbi:MAG: hypothetical protein HKP27_03810 [Myxococcales bacterium]|nr:hypothetical protein [Myxococcales bacterium]
MGTRNTLVALLLALSAVGATASDAFVGTIAVGLGPMNEVGEVKTSFSADARAKTEEGTINSRLHYRPGMVRDEMEMGGQKVVTIRRMDLKKVWMIMVGQGMYMESVPGQPSEQAPEYRLVSREVIGPETVKGMATTKYKSVYESDEGRFTGFTWYTEDHIAVKAVLMSENRGEKQRLEYELSNLKRDTQAPSLFEVPAGYRKLDMGGIPRMR